MSVLVPKAMAAAQSPVLQPETGARPALESTMASVEAVSADRWQVVLSELPLVPFEAHLADRFLMLSGKVPAQPRHTPAVRGARTAKSRVLADWELLKANATLPTLVKYASGLNGELCLQADIPVVAEDNLRLRLEQVCRGFAAALGATCPKKGLRNDYPTEGAPIDLAGLIAAAGWPCVTRRVDHCSVALDTRRGAHTALVTAAAGKVRAWTELASWDSISRCCRKGLAALLMCANARVRLARAVVTQDPPGGAAELEVVFQGRASAAEIRVALEALSVGADTCAPPADLLQQDAAAEIFLAVRGGPGASEDNSAGCVHPADKP